jgi:deoxyribodipyrimidine photo-lyase
MPINPSRVRTLSSSSYKEGVVVYQMGRDLRAHDNDALLFAQELAHKGKAQLIVTYVIWNYMWEGATRRFYDWVILSLQEIEKTLRAHNIPLMIVFEEKKLFEDSKRIPVPPSVGAVVIDQMPLRYMRRWKSLFLENNPHVPLYEVDAHNCVPTWEASSKEEFSARTIRPKLHKKLPDFLEEFDTLLVHEYGSLDTFPPIDWKEVKEKIVCNEKIHGVGGFSPGEQEAKKMLEYFLEHKCKGYEHDRNDFTKDGQSNLSPYISHGNLSRRRILLELCKKEKCTPEELFSPRANGSNGAMGSVASFVEECFVRAELAENFCYYNENYDRVEGFKPWAQETLRARRQDTRAYCYAREVFEEARTHDLLWNSAQRELILTGKMHGYLRMYWAKKILEWSKDEHEALRVANYLNDTYELDGRDPNGYVGCAWSIGGVHDRPWFPRPIFGTIRYMAESGVKKRGDIQLYCDTYRDSDIDKQQSLLYTIPN